MKFLDKIYNQNPWFIDGELISKDGHIENLKTLKYIWRNNDFLNYNFEDGVYIVTGQRQIGKTTHLKMLIQYKINNIDNKNLFYFNCDLLNSKQDIADLVEEYLASVVEKKNKDRVFILLDEISSVKDGILGIKYLIDSGKNKNITYILTGSSTVNINKTGEYLPGRRGKGVDFVFEPISFKEFLQLKYPLVNFDTTANLALFYKILKDKINLKSELDIYLQCGGIPRLINEYALEGSVSDFNLDLYKDWILSEIAKHGKKEIISKMLFERIINSIGSDISYNAFAQDMNVGSHNTVFDYLDFFQQSFVLKQVFNFDFHQKKINFRKNKKIYLNDISIYWVLDKWINARNTQNFISLQNDILKSALIENLVFLHLKRLFERLYFYRNKFEIDFITEDIVFEVKYRNQVSYSDFKQIMQFDGKRYVISKNDFEINKEYNIIPVELFLLMENF